jgi:hypothetical protein
VNLEKCFTLDLSEFEIKNRINSRVCKINVGVSVNMLHRRVQLPSQQAPIYLFIRAFYNTDIPFYEDENRIRPTKYSNAGSEHVIDITIRWEMHRMHEHNIVHSFYSSVT